jgi:hypothetical protein
MAGGNKRKTTMAKLNRERRLLEKRQAKQAKKAARKAAAAENRGEDGTSTQPFGQ